MGPLGKWGMGAAVAAVSGGMLLIGLGVPCPLPKGGLTAERVEAGRQMGVRAQAGRVPAPSRPALAGLVLDKTTELQARVWARTRGIACESMVRGMRFLKCENALTLAFGPSGRLVAVDLFRRGLDAREASRIMRQLAGDLKAKLGAPTEAKGDLSPGGLGGGSFSTSLAHFRFKDYLALLTATRIPWSGEVVVHEQYSSVGARLE